MRRTGKRGEGRFEPISWDEALDGFATRLCEIRDRHGHGALFVPYGTGGYSQLTGSDAAHRLLNCFGGHLDHYNSYSWGATNLVTPTVYGTRKCGNERQDWLNSHYIILWGWNPAEARDGTNSDWFIQEARRRGARVVCVDLALQGRFALSRFASGAVQCLGQFVGALVRRLDEVVLFRQPGVEIGYAFRLLFARGDERVAFGPQRLEL